MSGRIGRWLLATFHDLTFDTTLYLLVICKSFLLLLDLAIPTIISNHLIHIFNLE
jgi:hypothetical protein